MTGASVDRGRPAIWGVLNVTPDSFSDGGRFVDVGDARAHARALVADGADVIDVGGESTRPGAVRVTPGEERDRVLPVIEVLCAEGFTISIDTMNASTARAAVDAGASIVNDVSGGLDDEAMAETVAQLDVDFVAMHWRGHSDVWAQTGRYVDVVAEVRDELLARREALQSAGIDAARLWLDPGVGFAKSADDSWALLRGVDEFVALGDRVLVGASRKRFLAELLPENTPVTERDPLTAAVSMLCAEAGVAAVRVHDVKGTRRALDVWNRGRSTT